MSADTVPARLAPEAAMISPSSRVLRQLGGQLIRQALTRMDRAPALQGRPFSEPELIRPNTDARLFNVSHYGVMIPTLPEPYKYFSLMAILGTAGNRFIDTDHMLVDAPGRNCTQVSGTALAGSSHFGSYSMDRDCEIRADGRLIRLGGDVELSGSYPDIHLRVRRGDFELDIALACSDNVTWFCHTPVYKHLGLLAEYRGHIGHGNERQAIAGLCTYEYFTMAGPYGLVRKPLPPSLRVPTDFFSYQIVDLGDDTQLMLAKVCALGVTGLEAAWLRSKNDYSRTYATGVRFTVTSYEDALRIAPDGRAMLLPKTFTWTVQDGTDTLAEIHGTVDTPFTYGLCSGYVGGYRYEGRFRGKPVSGRAYIEYVDQRAV